MQQVQTLRDAGVPVTVLLMSGRPMFVNPELNRSDAFVASWLPGTEASGIADVLFADSQGNVAFDMTGQLSFQLAGRRNKPEQREFTRGCQPI